VEECCPLHLVLKSNGTRVVGFPLVLWLKSRGISSSWCQKWMVQGWKYCTLLEIEGNEAERFPLLLWLKSRGRRVEEGHTLLLVSNLRGTKEGCTSLHFFCS